MLCSVYLHARAPLILSYKTSHFTDEEAEV